MRRIDEQLRQGVAILEIIDRRRHAEDDPHIGSAIERTILDSCLDGLEEDLDAAVPGELIMTRPVWKRWRR